MHVPKLQITNIYEATIQLKFVTKISRLIDYHCLRQGTNIICIYSVSSLRVKMNIVYI